MGAWRIHNPAGVARSARRGASSMAKRRKHRTPPRDPRTGLFLKRGAKRASNKKRRKNVDPISAGLNKPKRRKHAKKSRRPGSTGHRKANRRPGSTRPRRRNAPLARLDRRGIFGLDRLARVPGLGWAFRSANFWTAGGVAVGATAVPMGRKALYVKAFKFPGKDWYSKVNEKGAPTWRRTLADAGGEIVLATPAAIASGMIRSKRMAGAHHFSRGVALGGYGHGLGLILARGVYGMLPEWIRPVVPTDVPTAAEVSAAGATGGGAGFPAGPVMGRNRVADYLQQGDQSRIKDYLQQGDQSRIKDYMQQGDMAKLGYQYAPRPGALLGHTRFGQNSEGPVAILTAPMAVGEGDVAEAVRDAIATAVEDRRPGAMGLDTDVWEDAREERTF